MVVSSDLTFEACHQIEQPEQPAQPPSLSPELSELQPAPRSAASGELVSDHSGDTPPGNGKYSAVLSTFRNLGYPDIEENEPFLTVLRSYRHYDRGTEVLDQHAPTNPLRIVVSGWVAAVVRLQDGRQRVVDFHLPGDVIGSCWREFGPSPTAYVAVADARITAKDNRLALLLDEDPLLRRICVTLEREQRCRLVRTIARFGHMTAFQRVACFCLECHDRLRRSGQASDNRFYLPIAQSLLADALGISTVHVNRVLQKLRTDDVLSFENSGIRIIDFGKLRSLSR